MTEPLLSIGAFARAAGLSASALRHYDEVGLLPAAHVDPVTGYRFYDEGQQDVAQRIAVLRELGLSIAEMTRVVLLTGDELARALVQIALEQEARAARCTAALHALARAAVVSTGSVATWVDPVQLLDAIDRCAPLTGEAPFDAVLLLVSNRSVSVWATDRYRLAAAHIPATSEEARAVDGAVVPLAAWPQGRVLLDPCALSTAREVLVSQVRVRQVLVTVHDGRLHVGSELTPSRAADTFADLPSLMDAMVGQVVARAIVESGMLDGLPRLAGQDDDVVSVDIAGVQVCLSRPLLRGVVATLVDGPLVFEAGRADQPVIVSSAARPGHRVALMSRRP